MSTASSTSVGASDTRRRLLDELRRSDVDVDAARERVEARVGARRRRRRIAGGATGAVALLIVLVVAGFALGSQDPDDVVADREEDTPTTSAPTTTSTTTPVATEPAQPVETTAAPTTSAVTTTTAPTTTAPVAPQSAPPTSAPPTSPPPTTPSTTAGNAPMSAQLTVATPRVPAGSTSAIEVSWSDPDHSGSAPTYLVDWGDPAVAAAPPAAPTGSCDRPGRPAADTERLEFRHATPGRHRIRVEVRTCADGEFAERLVLEGSIEVTEPELDGATAVAVVLHRADSAAPGLLLPALDAASARLGDRSLPERSPVLSQRVGQGAATVVVVPPSADGPVELTWPSTDCTAIATVELEGAEPTPAPRFLLSSSC